MMMKQYALLLMACIFVATANGFEFKNYRPQFDDGFQTWPHGILGSTGGFWPFEHHRQIFPASRRADENVEELTLRPERDPEPLDIDSISGSIGNPDDTHVEIETHPSKPSNTFNTNNGYHPSDSSVLFHQFFGNQFFNNFGFGGFGGNRRNPWWKGPNVCTERQENLEDWDASESSEKKSAPTIHFGLHLSFNSCVERSHKHVCTTIVNEQDRKKTLKVTHQCCHGFARKPNADVYAECEKVDLRSVSETAEKLGANEFIKMVKKNDLEEILQRNVTVFMPSDNVLKDLTEDMLESNLVMRSILRRRRSNDLSDLTNKDLILNHIVDDWINIEDIENEQILVSEFDNRTIRMNIFPAPPNDKEYEYAYRYTANCAPLIKVNQMATNGIVHLVDGVLAPVTQNLMDIIRDRSDMAVLRTVLEKTDLAKMLESDAKHFTLFAPTDMAFNKLDPQLRRTIKDANGCALNILKNHILDMTFCSAAVVNDAKTGAINTLGLKINLERVENSKETIQRDTEIADMIGIKNDDMKIMVNNEAEVLVSDIMGTNGVMHVIDTVLTTESGMPLLSMLEKHNLTVFKRLIEANNIEKDFDIVMNASFFIPTNKAFEDTQWLKDLDENPDSLKGRKDLSELLKYHIARPLTKSCDLSEQIMDTEAGRGLRVNLYSTHSVFNNVMNRATANCARLVHFDDDTCGSVLHQVDRVLVPPKMNLLQMLEANKNYGMYLQLVRDANLTELLEDPKQSLTLLVPTNDIFRELTDLYYELKSHPKQLENFIKVHILDDVLCCAGIVQSEWPFVRLVKTINDYELKLARDRRPKIQNAGVTKCDIVAENGLILEVNDVISVRKQKPQEIPLSTFLDL